MLEIVVGIIALVSLGIAVSLAAKVQRLEERLRLAQQTPTSLPATAAPLPDRPLEGLRIGLAITQDHAHPIFANLLKEQLLVEEARSVSLLTSSDADWQEMDILISGKLVCNGYAEIYYEADFTCNGPSEPICVLIERPPHGDRPINLAVELVSRLKAELGKLDSRNERRRALRELGD